MTKRDRRQQRLELVAKGEAPSALVPAPRLVVSAVAALLGVGLASGTTGLLAHPLRHAVTWLAMATVIIAGWPRVARFSESWLGFVLLIALALVVSSLVAEPFLNVFAIPLVLTWLLPRHKGISRSVLSCAFFVVTVFSLYRLLCSTVPLVWLFSDRVSGSMAGLLGKVVGRRLELGSTFSGIGALVLSAGWYVPWLIYTQPPRLSRGLWGAGGIIAVQFTYLAIGGAVAEPLARLSGESPGAPGADGLLCLGAHLLWQLPLTAYLLHMCVVAAMIRWSPWREAVAQPREGRRDGRLMWLRIGALTVTILALVAIPSFLLHSPSLSGKKIVLFEKGYLNWLKPKHGEYGRLSVGMYGMLPHFIRSLGGDCALSSDLTEEELSAADVVLLIYPNEPWREGQLERIRQFVERGGTLCVFGEHTVREKDGGARFNDVLEGTGIRVRFDSAYYAVGGWLHSYDPLVHPTTLGVRDERNQFGLVIGASLDVRWPARPVIVGRWGWSDWGDEGGNAMMGNKAYDAGERLGDLVLVAEQRVGKGRIIVFGDTSGISNGINIGTHVFNSRLFAYLCSRNLLGGRGWREAGTVLAAGVLVALVASRRKDAEATWAFILLPLAFVLSAYQGSRKMDVFPKAHDGREYQLAYLDAAHLNLFSSESWRDDGLMGLALTLMRNGYLALMLPEFRSERVLEADLVVCVAPARGFTPAERATVRRFLEKGGIFILTVGREEAGPVASLLSDLGFTLGESLPAETATLRHPPLGHFKSPYLDTGRYRVFVRFHAAWPVAAIAEDAKVLAYGPGDRPVICMRRIGKGKAVVIGDTCFAMNKNLEVESGCAFEGMRENPHFWRWLITQLRDEPMWIPPDPRLGTEATEVQ